MELQQPFEFAVNWVGATILFALAAGITTYARRVSGGWTRPWLSITPVWWFVMLFLVPPPGYLLLLVNLIVHRRVPGAITGR